MRKFREYNKISQYFYDIIVFFNYDGSLYNIYIYIFNFILIYNKLTTHLLWKYYDILLSQNSIIILLVNIEIMRGGLDLSPMHPVHWIQLDNDTYSKINACHYLNESNTRKHWT